MLFTQLWIYYCTLDQIKNSGRQLSHLISPGAGPTNSVCTRCIQAHHLVCTGCIRVPLFLVPLGAYTFPAVGLSDVIRPFFSNHSKKKCWKLWWTYSRSHIVDRAKCRSYRPTFAYFISYASGFIISNHTNEPSSFPHLEHINFLASHHILDACDIMN